MVSKKIVLLSIIGILFFAISSTQTIFAQDNGEAVPETYSTDPNRLFNDFDITDEEYIAIYYLKNKGVVEGYPDGELKPEININRAEFTKIILEAKKDIEIIYDPAFTFPDNPEGEWFAKYVSTAKKEGIIEGYPDGYFRPEQNINYPEALKIIINTFGLTSLETSSEFYDSYYLDSYQGEWYSQYLNTASTTNIFSVDWDFEPADFITRGESFDTLYRTMIIEETPYDIFYYPIIFLGEQGGIVYSYPSGSFKLPLVYTNIDPKVNVQLYKSDVNTLLDSRIECNCYRYSANYQIKQEFIDRMQLISDSEVQIETVESDEPPIEPYYDPYYQVVEKDGFLPLSNITEKGIYFINVENELLPPQHLFVVVSDNNMIYHSGDDNDLIWLVNHLTEEKVEGAELKYYNLDYNADMSANVNYLSTQTTDESGVAFEANRESNYIVAEKDGDVTLLNKYYSNYYGDDSTYKDYQFFAYTDRPVYRPGDQVNFKIIARNFEDGKYKLFSSSDTLDVEIYNYLNYSENTVFEKSYRPSEYSTVTGSFDLSSESSTGDYYFRVKINDQDVYAYYKFNVEAYKKDEYSLYINTDKESYVNGDTAEITVYGEYFFGQPVTNQEITYTVLRSSSYYINYEDGYSYSGKGYYGYGEEILTGKGELNEYGEYNFDLDIENELYEDDYYGYSGLTNATYEVRVETTDASNIPVEKTYYFSAYAAEFDLYIDQLTPVPEAGEEVKLLLTTLNHEEKPYTKSELDIKVFEQTYKKIDENPVYDHWTDSYIPYPEYEYEENEIYSVSGAKPDSKGEYTLKFTPEKPAQIRIEISGTDASGNTMATNYYLTVYGEDDEYTYESYYGGYQSIIINPDKNKYSVGDTAKIIIRTPKDSGEALFMTYKNGIETYEIIELTGGETEIELPITEDLLPGFSIGIDTLHNNQFITGDRMIEIDPGDMELNIEVTPEKDIALPGEEILYTITVTDSNGDPVQTDLSFALVDKAIFEIEEQNLESILSGFYYPRYYYLSNFTNTIVTQFEKDMPDYYAEPLTLAEEAVGDLGGGLGGGAEGEGGGGGLRDDLASNTRSLFLDTAHWVANIETNVSGMATAKVELPDNLTTWTATVVGNTKDTKLGVGTEDIVVQKDLIISPYTPRFVTLDDELTLRAVVRNYDADNDLEVILGGDGFELLNTTGNNDNYTLNLPKGQSHEATWDIRVTSEDELNLIFSVEENSGTAVDKVELTLPVNLYGEEKLTSYTGEDSAKVTLETETGDYENIKELSVILSPTLAENITTSLESLTGYPYGCVEQTMSRFIPDIVAYANRDKVDFNEDIFDDIDKMIDDGLTRLYEFQHSDGGWGWWEDDESTPKNTAYVMYGFIIAKQNGFSVNNDIYNAGLGALEVFNMSSDNYSYQPYMMYVLTMAGQTTTAELNEIAARTDLNAIDHGYLALSFNKLGSASEAQAEIAKLKEMITEETKYAYFEEEIIDYESMTSNELSTAVALEAFAEIDPENELTVKMIRWLDSKKQGGFYHETHSTAQAVIALVRYLVNTNQVDPNITYEVKVSGYTVYEGNLDENKEYAIDLADLNFSNPSVEIVKSGTGTLYYNVVQTEFIGEKDINAYDNGLKITRTYMNENNVPLSGYISAGDVIKVNIKVEAPSDYNYLIIKDNLPAGFEPIETENNWYWYDYGYEESGYYEEWVDNQDLFDDHAALFVTNLYSGEHNYTYSARAVTPGTFQADPTSAYLMYMPEISGGGKSASVEIR